MIHFIANFCFWKKWTFFDSGRAIYNIEDCFIHSTVYLIYLEAGSSWKDPAARSKKGNFRFSWRSTSLDNVILKLKAKIQVDVAFSTHLHKLETSGTDEILGSNLHKMVHICCSCIQNIWILHHQPKNCRFLHYTWPDHQQIYPLYCRSTRI